VERGGSLEHVFVDRATTSQMADDLIWEPVRLVVRRPGGPYDPYPCRNHTRTQILGRTEGTNEMARRLRIVLVHGAFADGSSWSAVIERLQEEGYHVIAPQFPCTSLAEDVARLRQVLEFQDGPTVVVGHSYGGQVMTALGRDAPNVVGLVYIAAFGLDQGESLGALFAQGPLTPALAHLFTDKRGFAWLSEDDFVNHFAGDVNPTSAKVMYAVQQALASTAFTDVMSEPAWEYVPSWYLVATEDEAIPPDAERQFARRMGATTVEVPSSHVPMVSHPKEVVDLIGSALEACQPAG
jgi:pimeloyl-ACP methyl ester carboxylesterase